jgi:hypothetical protein
MCRSKTLTDRLGCTGLVASEAVLFFICFFWIYLVLFWYKLSGGQEQASILEDPEPLASKGIPAFPCLTGYDSYMVACSLPRRLPDSVRITWLIRPHAVQPPGQKQQTWATKSHFMCQKRCMYSNSDRSLKGHGNMRAGGTKTVTAWEDTWPLPFGTVTVTYLPTLWLWPCTTFQFLTSLLFYNNEHHIYSIQLGTHLWLFQLNLFPLNGFDLPGKVFCRRDSTSSCP